MRETKNCMVLNNFYWGVWAIMMLAEKEETDVNAFNWEFARGRVLLHKQCVQDFGIGQI